MQTESAVKITPVPAYSLTLALGFSFCSYTLALFDTRSTHCGQPARAKVLRTSDNLKTPRLATHESPVPYVEDRRRYHASAKATA